jgi:hypothetical protein
LQDRLNTLSKQGQWVEMGKLITDEVLETFAVVREPEHIAPELSHPMAMSFSAFHFTPLIRATRNVGARF